MTMRRVVITGLGIVSPLGSDLHTFWNGLVKAIAASGRSRASTPMATALPSAARSGTLIPRILSTASMLDGWAALLNLRSHRR